MRTEVLQSLEIMGKGMAGVFTVIFLLTLIVVVLSKLTSKKAPESE